MNFVCAPLLILLSALVAAGCVSAVITKDLQIKPDARTGLVFMSGTYSGVPNTAMNLMCKPVGSTAAFDVKGFIIRNPYLDLDFGPPGDVGVFEHRNPGGRVAFLVLPPGTWEIFQIQGYGRGEKGLVLEKPISIPFEVTPGRAVYLGNIHIRIDGTTVGILISDKRERDLKLVIERAPLIRPEQIDVRIAAIAR